MFSSLTKPRFLVITSMIILAALVRFIPHPPNFAPIAALALFGGKYYTDKKFAFIVPVLVMIITDAVIGFHYLIPAVYISFLIIAGIGLLLRKTNKVSWLIAGSIAASTLFFILTNFYEWYAGILYPQTFNGLITCYVAAIPFFFNTLIADLFFVIAMSMTFEFLTRKYQVFAEV
ncbi:MAG: hypothetical protein HND40_03480 [Ignavibacteriota bacterium]|nr:hypothetical protein [Ignavibacteriota bacterium]MBW7842134.1 hypothetical protein [Ignavibacterium sp.]MCO6449014.1 hypothetical protein [Ignavibacterium album]MCZ2268334.1 hypothetical protein [Ignavibacteriales bacterium]MDX9713087.1 hypothetical protein [Ignavibacteriaceae bacterium]